MEFICLVLKMIWIAHEDELASVSTGAHGDKGAGGPSEGSCA